MALFFAEIWKNYRVGRKVRKLFFLTLVSFGIIFHFLTVRSEKLSSSIIKKPQKCFNLFDSSPPPPPQQDMSASRNLTLIRVLIWLMKP
jgi:hypothetical protein